MVIDPPSLPPPPDYPPPVEAFEYAYRFAELLMMLVSLDIALTAGHEKGVEFAYKILKATYDVGFRDIDGNLSEEEVATRKVWRAERASREAGEVILQHRRLVYSLALIMACSIFELFLNHLLDVLLVKEPRVAGGRTMRLAELYEAGSSAEIFSRFREAEIKDFERLGIKEKMRYFSKKCNITREVLFSFNHCSEEEGKRARPRGEDFLYSTFETRNSIAHRGQRPLTELKDVADVIGFFQALVIQLSVCVGAKYGMRVLATAEEHHVWRHRDYFRQLFQQTPGTETKTR